MIPVVAIAALVVMAAPAASLAPVRVRLVLGGRLADPPLVPSATGVEVTGGPGAMEAVAAMARPLASLGAATVSGSGGGVDIAPLAWAGVPLLSLAQDTSRYFDWHHSAADTLDKVDPGELAQATAAFAWMAWALADSPETLPRPSAPDREPWWKRPTR